ncbi:hypothetical protein BD413DRAFT_607733 [Trametes elegans]|nr:hypothetical protein BD413DRAFT_607733 [Trametes elegans]
MAAVSLPETAHAERLVNGYIMVKLDVCPVISAKRVDGAETVVSGRAIERFSLEEDFCLFAEQLWVLKAFALPPSVVAIVRKLLEAEMPVLEDLSIEFAQPDKPDQASTNTPMTFSLPPSRFPALRSLVLQGSSACLVPPLVLHLRRLIMGGEYSLLQNLSLSAFLDCLSSFKCMEELELTNCFAPSKTRDLRRPYSASHLVSVTIEDYPSNIHQLVSALILPAKGTVVLKGNLRGSTVQECWAAFSGMLPVDSRSLPVLRDITHIDVYHPPEQCYMTGKTECGDILDLEVVTDALNEPSLRRTRGELFEMMVRGARDIFPAAPVLSLAFLGHVDCVPAASWVAGLAGFHQLRNLDVDDVELRTELREVFAALKTPSPISAPQPLCPLLENLSLYGDIQSLDLLDALWQCLKWRRIHWQGSSPPLRAVFAEFFCDKLLPAPLVDHFEEKLSALVEKCVLDVTVMRGIRSR